MSRSTLRTLVAATMVAAVMVSGCSLIPGLGDAGNTAQTPPAPASTSTTATKSKEATAKPAVSKTTSGTTVPVPGVPKKPLAKISSDIDGIELRDLQAKGATIIDLQPKADFEREHIDGAVNVPMAKFASTAAGWSHSRVLVVYDRTGLQGQAAQTWLERKGFTRIYHLFRGMQGYDAELVGDDPRPIPPRQPVLYYFYAGKSVDVAQGITSDDPSLHAADALIRDLKAEFGGRFELYSYDVSSVEGLSRFLEFDGKELPMFRLVTEEGVSEDFTGTGTFEQVRGHLKRAIEDYEAERD